MRVSVFRLIKLLALFKFVFINKLSENAVTLLNEAKHSESGEKFDCNKDRI